MTAFEEERNRLRERVWSFLDVKQGTRYLDVGIGHTGYSLNRLLELSLDATSIDIDVDFLSKKKTHRAHFVQCNAAKLPFKENAFNMSLAHFTFHEIDPALHRAVVSELYRVSQKIMVVEPAIGKDPLYRRYQEIWTEAMHSIEQYEDYQTIDYWTDLLQESDARIVTSETLSHTVRLSGQEGKEYMKGVAGEMREDGVSEEFIKQIYALSEDIATNGMLFSDINIIIGHLN